MEENLLYLAQKKKLSNSDIYSIALNHPVSENILVGLYQCGTFNLKRVENYAKQKNMNLEEIKEKIKQQKLKNPEIIDLNDTETWNLLTTDERLQIAVKDIDNGRGEKIKGRIEELYNIQEIANLYREIYNSQNKNDNPNNKEKLEKYKNLIKLHNKLGLENTDNIINILEDELSNEMLMNLYCDGLIDLDVLESYGEKELVIETYNQGKLQEKALKKAIIKYPIPLKEEQIYQYYQKGILTSRDILDLYINDRINLESLKTINRELPEEEKIDLKLTEKELANLYKEAQNKKKQKNTNLETNIKYKRYGLIYQNFKREGLDENQKITLDKKLLENIPDVTQEDIIELYRDNLLTLETILAQGGDELVKKLVLQGDLRTNDSRRYFKSEQTNVKIEEILQNPNVDETEKIILIYTTYGDDKNKRDNLVEYLSAYSTDLNGEATKQRGEGKGEKDSKKTITDPYERWKLFTLLDPNYSRKYVGGYLIVKLHNTQKAIIEKMYEKKNGKIISAYGTATFVLDVDEYEKLENELIVNNKFNIAKIRKVAKENPEVITKITHHPPVLDEEGNEKTSWGKRLLVNICNKDEQKMYSEGEIKQIEECMKSIEKSRQDFSR